MAQLARKLFQFGDDGLVARRRLPHLDANLGTYRQIDIYSGTQLDESQVLINIAFFTFLGIGNDTACHSTSNLTA